MKTDESFMSMTGNDSFQIRASLRGVISVRRRGEFSVFGSAELHMLLLSHTAGEHRADIDGERYL